MLFIVAIYMDNVMHDEVLFGGQTVCFWGVNQSISTTASVSSGPAILLSILTVLLGTVNKARISRPRS